MIVTGERVMTAEGGFNPTWQRHVATYALCAELLPEDGRLLDLGCGIGHSFELLAPRETVGVDIEPSVLEGQQRETVVADMRALPFEDASFQSLLSVQSIEHVPDPERVLSQARRVLELNGIAVFVTPNRLTFGAPEEIIDPYHYREYDPELLRLDPLRARRLIPRRTRQLLYDGSLTLARRRSDPAAEAIGQDDFYLAEETPGGSARPRRRLPQVDGRRGARPTRRLGCDPRT